ncbi:MAG TPA: hypothetical protein VMW43_08175 [Bacteroidota bacterium]|nr:hypothetical protein [Bacteroidota bacterium]
MKYLVPLILLITLAIIVPVRAQIDSSRFLTTDIALTGGPTYPHLPLDLRDYWTKGWNAGAEIGFNFKPGPLGYGTVLLDADMNRFTFDNAKYRSTFYQTNIMVTKNPTWMYDVTVNVRGTITGWSSRIQPFFVLGVGYVKISGADVTVSGDTSFTHPGESRSGFAWTGGIGIDFPVNDSFGIFVEARSVLTVVDPTRQYFPVSGGIRLRIPGRPF